MSRRKRRRRDRRFRPGMLVRIAEDCRDLPLSDRVCGQTATYEGRYDPDTGKRYVKSRLDHPDNSWTYNPRLRLEDGTVIWGYECWWLPLDEAQDCEALAGIEGDVAELKRRLQSKLKEKVGS